MFQAIVIVLHIRSLRIEDNCEKSLKDLFWSQLNYDRVNKELSRRNWSDRLASELASNPLLLASDGKDDGFRIIYSRFNGDRLLKQKEREVVNKLLPDNPYSLFVFSNETRSQWHFLNVKYDDSPQKRKLFRRIKVESPLTPLYQKAISF